MVRWLRWHCPPDTGFEIRALAVWGRARYLSVTEAPHNTDFHMWMGKKHFCFFETAETGNRTPNSGVKGSGANHYPRAPAQVFYGQPISMCFATCQSQGKVKLTSILFSFYAYHDTYMYLSIKYLSQVPGYRDKYQYTQYYVNYLFSLKNILTGW